MASAEFVVALLTLLLTTLALTLPATQARLQSCFQCFVCHLVPSRGYCYRLLWKDVPHGRLHQCHPNCQHVNPLTRDDHDRTNCWDDGWGQVLDRAWNLMKLDPADLRYRARTPFSLLFCGPYIQIDVQTLKVLLILTAEGNRTLETPDVTKSLDIRKIRGIQTVHLKTHGYRSINMSLTKQEVDRFVEGYPPFYSTIIKTTGGIYLEHPLNDSGKIGRGSWVLAVGMSTANGPVCTIHNMQTISSEKAEAGWEGTLVMAAFKMIARTLSQLKDYEETRGPHTRPGPARCMWSTAAISCFEAIRGPEYIHYPWSLKQQQIERSPLFESVVGECPCSFSCIGQSPHSASCRRDQHARKDPASYLTKAQCEVAFEIFNHDVHFVPNLDIIWPVFPEILQTLILGVSEVQHYFQYTGRKLEIPQSLAEQKYIYLRQCDQENE